MQIRILGCYGSEYPGHLTSCFLINDTLVIDAGAMTSSLTLKEQAKIDNILLSHGHLDHLLDIGFLADNVIGSKLYPVKIHAAQPVLDVLMGHIMNNRIWPDFTKIPTVHHPVLSVQPINPMKTFNLGGLRIRAIPVNHTVPTCGFIVQENHGAAFVYSGDTGPTEELWEAANRLSNLKALFIELSFPNRFQERADVSLHFTPQTLDIELDKIKLGSKIPVRLYHMKPHFLDEIEKEIKALKRPNVKLLRMGQRIKL